MCVNCFVCVVSCHVSTWMLKTCTKLREQPDDRLADIVENGCDLQLESTVLAESPKRQIRSIDFTLGRVRTQVKAAGPDSYDTSRDFC